MKYVFENKGKWLKEAQDSIKLEGYHKDKRPGDVQVGTAKDGKPLYGRDKSGKVKEPAQQNTDKAVDKTEKELDIALGNSINTVRRLASLVKGLKADIEKEKANLKNPNANHYEVKKKIDDLSSTLKTAEDKQKKAKAVMQYNFKQFDAYHRSKGEN